MSTQKITITQITITRTDERRLSKLLNDQVTQAIGSQTNLQDMGHELERAIIVESDEVPADIVTMNSTIRLRDCATGEIETFTLVYPNDANIAQNKLSILAPIGTAILGQKQGDEVRWRVPGGSRCFHIEEVVYQPEREGALHL